MVVTKLNLEEDIFRNIDVYEEVTQTFDDTDYVVVDEHSRLRLFIRENDLSEVETDLTFLAKQSELDIDFDWRTVKSNYSDDTTEYGDEEYGKVVGLNCAKSNQDDLVDTAVYAINRFGKSNLRIVHPQEDVLSGASLSSFELSAPRTPKRKM